MVSKRGAGNNHYDNMSDQSQGPAGLPSQVTYEPLPSIYRAFAAGASPYAIITETIDNSIDFVRRQALNDEYYPETLEVNVQFEPSETDAQAEDDSSPATDSVSTSETGRLIITDNAGGVPPEELAKFFQLGHSDAPPKGIGRFGVGAKRLIGIGNHIKYESHAHGREVAAGFEVDAQKLEGEAAESSQSTYSSEVYQVDDLKEGTTRIIVDNLNKGVWDRLCGSKDGSIDRDAEDSLWRLKETYEHFLRDDIEIDPGADHHSDSIELDLNWGVLGVSADNVPDEVDSVLQVAEDVTPPEPVDLSFVSFDGLWPRKYEGMPFANDPDTPPEDSIRVDIEVGLMPHSDADKAGLTVTMNNRNVLFRDTNNDLFSTRYLGKFRESAGHGRLHCIVSIHGEADEMPWSDTKDSLDGTEQVTEEILNVTENALEEYRRQTYSNLPDWILEVYSIESLKNRGYYDNEGIRTHIEWIPKSNSKVNSPRFNKKPGETSRSSSYRQYPDRDKLIRTTYLHAALGIRCDDSVDENVEPAYSNFFETVYDGRELEVLPQAETPDVDDYEIPLDRDEVIPVVEDLKKLAIEHAEQGKRLTSETDGAHPWLLPQYSVSLRSESESADSLEEIDSFDFEEWRTYNSVSEEVRIEDTVQNDDSVQTVHPNREQSQVSGPPQRDAESGLSQTSVGGSSDRNQLSGPDVSASSGSSDENSPSDQPTTSHATGSSQGRVSEYTRHAASEATPTSPGITFGGDHYELSDEQMSALLEFLDLDEEATPEEIFESLEDALEQRAKLVEQLRDLGELVNVEALLGEPPAIDKGRAEE